MDGNEKKCQKLFEFCASGDRVGLADYIISSGCNPSAYDTRDSVGRTALHIACRHGHLDTIHVLVKSFGCNLNVTDMKGNLPVHDACVYGHLAAVHLLFMLSSENRSDKADKVFITDLDGNNMLHKACQSGSVSLVRYIKTLFSDSHRKFSYKLNLFLDSMATYTGEKHGSVNTRLVECILATNNFGDTPLHVACRHGHLNIVQLFHTILPLSGYITTLVTVASQCNYHSLVIYLTNLKHSNTEVLDFNSEFGKIDMDRKVLPSRDPGRKGRSVQTNLMHVALSRSRFRQYSNFLQEDVHESPVNLRLDCSSCGFKYWLKASSFPTTCTRCGMKNVKVFVRNRKEESGKYTKPFYKGTHSPATSSLNIAARCGNLVLFESLSSVTSAANRTLLHAACRSDSTMMVTQVISKLKCDVNSEDSAGNTPLHVSFLYGSVKVASMLISHKDCDINKHNSIGMTPVHFACKYDRLELCKQLIAKGAALDTVTKLQQTPLHFACYHPNLELVEMLLSCHSIENTLNKADAFGDSPLYNACRFGQVGIVQLLVEKGSNPLFVNKLTQETPVHIACRMGRVDLLKVLLQRYKGILSQINTLGATPLHLAVERNSVESIHFLIENDFCDLTTGLNRNQSTLLHISCLREQPSIVKSLLAKHSSWNQQDRKGNSGLHIACSKKSNHLVNLLKDHCSITVQNSRGQTPIHVACEKKDIDSVKCLLSKHSGSLDSYVDSDGNTPLHVACRVAVVEIVDLLLNFCEITTQNKINDTPVHIATKIGCTGVLKSLLLRYSGSLDSFVNDDGDTVLHVAVEHSSLNRLDLLQAVAKHCSVTKQNLAGDTPIHIACKKGDLIATQFLIENCTVLVTNKNGDNYLHAACESGSLDVVKLILEKYSVMDLSTCSILGGNSEGNSPLHTACLIGSLDIVLYLIQNASCDIYSFNNKQQTPLYCALMNAHEELVIKMMSLDIFDPKRDYMKGQPLLHCVLKESIFGCCYGLFESLIRMNICNINQCNESGNSVLHSAVLFSISSGGEIISFSGKAIPVSEFEYRRFDPIFFMAVWEFLLSTDGISIINHPNENGDTPLHLICQFVGYLLDTHSKCEYICKMLLNYGNSTVTPSLSHKNKYGKTPIQVAPYSLYRLLISYGANPNDVYEEFAAVLNKYKTEQPLDPRMKIIVLGNSTAGKTTLIEALKADENSDRDIIQVNGPTVGMTTSLHQSEALGQVKFHDFAGQPEYESNNSAFLKASLCSTSLAQAPIFILTVDASKISSVEKVLKYWLSFIKNHSPAQLEPPPHLITVASHIDLVPQNDHQMILKKIETAMNSVQSWRIKSFGPILLDCRKVGTEAMESLTELLSQSCSSLRSCIEIDCRCHILFTRLIEWFQETPAIKFESIQKMIRNEVAATSTRDPFFEFISPVDVCRPDTLLPFATDALLTLIESLHSGGHLILLKGQECKDVEDYWIVMDNDSLYKKVSGTLFAPDNFNMHPTLQTNTGVVSSDMLSSLFQDIDITLATKFLEYSEFCQKIVDKHTLQLIDASLCDISDDVVKTKSMSLRQPTDPTCSHYFFPAFIKSDRPNEVWGTLDCMGLSYYSCGWYLQCQPDHFLESRFLQVLLLRLTFSFAAASASSDSSNNQYLFRRCDIWKNGIHWSSRTGVEVLVEVVEQTSAVLMLCRSFEGKEMEAVKLRSAVLKKILDTKEEFCPSTDTDEYLLHPSALKCSGYPDISKPDAKIHISEVAQAVSNGEPCIIDLNQHPIPLEQVLHFDPYLLIGKDSILSLWSEDLSDQELTNDFFMRLSSQLSKFRNQVARVLNVSSEEVLHLSQEWRESPQIFLLHIFKSWKSKTDHAFYKKLREEFGCHSIFCGRNPMVSHYCCLISTLYM